MTDPVSGFQNWLLVALLGLILADALVTRTEWRIPEFVRRKQKKERKPPRPAKEKAVVASEPAPAEAPEPAKAGPPPESGDRARERRSRFARAKRRQ